MSSVASVSSGVSDLFQALSNTGSSSVSSVLSSTSLQSKLEGSSSGDIVKLSEQALQLQQANGLFGASTSSPAVTDPASLLLQAVNSATTGTPSTSSSTTTAPFTGEPTGTGSISLTG
jgi:hypothetical protein